VSESSVGRRVPALLYAVTIFLSAFLLFQVQPLIAKLILPWFGGSAAVWTSCMLFFQVALLGGYVYAHWINKQSGRTQTIVHLGLFALSFLSLPILPSAWWRPHGSEDPLLRILGLLAATVGLPYFLLSSTSPLLQAWYSRSNGGAMPYRFFALSNAGSMLGLLTYPILVEPWLATRGQAWMWSASYGVFVLVCALVAWRSRGVRVQTVTEDVTPPPSRVDRLIWMALAACASALMLAVTNHLTQNVAAIPFLWVLPLCLYLLSFILCFDSDRWYRPRLFGPLAAVSLPAIAVVISFTGLIMNIRLALAFFCATLFVLCMVCQGELARRRPSPAWITSFYLMISAGGAIGGLFIALAAPYFFNALYDLPAVVSLTGFLFVWLLWRMHDSRMRGPFAANLARAALLVLPLFLAVGTTALLAISTLFPVGNSRVLVRNFYGSLRVYDKLDQGPMGPARVFLHGTVDHGEQFLRPEHRRFAATYYSAGSGVGLAIRHLWRQGPMHTGVIGLGAGVLAAYSRPIDRLTFYEINPLVLEIADTEFSFLSDCPAPHQVILGDARLSLESERPQQFDLLAVDAFSGDSVPVHLLTREAFALYWRHLKPDGVLAVHITNRNLGLGPVVALAAAEGGKRAMVITNDADYPREVFGAEWVLVTSRLGFFNQPEISTVSRKIAPSPGLQTWRDDYSNLFNILRHRNL
jgi:SAM-dependent methyltransferase